MPESHQQTNNQVILGFESNKMEEINTLHHQKSPSLCENRSDTYESHSEDDDDDIYPPLFRNTETPAEKQSHHERYDKSISNENLESQISALKSYINYEICDIKSKLLVATQNSQTAEKKLENQA